MCGNGVLGIPPNFSGASSLSKDRMKLFQVSASSSPKTDWTSRSAAN